MSSKFAAHKLQTARLELDPVREAHAPIVYDAMSDQRLWVFFPARRPKSVDDLRRLYRKWEGGNPDANSDEEWENWICFRREDHVAVGGMQATIVAHGVCYVGYAVYSAFHRQGYAKEALSAVIDHVRRQHDVNTVIAEMDTRNIASQGLAQSLGFVRVEEHQAVERGNGLIADEYVYELTLS